MLTRTRPLAFVNARVVLPDGEAASIRFTTRVLDIDARPGRHDAVLDLHGAFVFPGLVNAHDHLELNHYGRLRPRERYANASAWIDDLRPLLHSDAVIRTGRGHPLGARLFFGGLKNLLAGVTTVAHHNPLYRALGRHFPVRVVKRFGWAHSFQLQTSPVGAGGEPGGDVRARSEATPADWPFMLHVAEGVDEAAAAELPRLEALGCLRSNTVLVHGVALSAADWSRVRAAGAGLVWCPASNLFLLGRTAPVHQFLDTADGSNRHIGLGSDSRLTGARDLLEELKVAAAAAPVRSCDLLRMVTTTPARLLRLPEAGRIAIGNPADLAVLPSPLRTAADAILAASRRDLGLVLVGGRPMVGSPSYQAAFEARRTPTRPFRLDGAGRLVDAALARAIAACPIREPGLDACDQTGSGRGA